MTQPCSEDTPPATTTATAAAHGHAEQAVLVHATTHAPEHVWQAVQEGARVVLERAAEAVLHLVQVAVVAVAVVQVAVQDCVAVVSTNHERHKHTNNSGM